ncbi:MAG: hypothetical protein Unbinned664contig1000_40 [Prokaryotic dsDNA virus sp.]|mgnify:CR=1 FL=1|nr:MAG: hypothetical protein Unbinned664contig1000_40 [Prokaryotic dsDNA virus sp.]|tara:strand:- start:6002 stop:8029 length:2028 start_codon:yes stop_codon:yes gene_type:complete
MPTPRSRITDFAYYNPKYINATVAFYTVDENGDRTETLAPLYAGTTGSAQVENPQRLGSRGKFQNPVYHEVDVIGVVESFGEPSHTSGVIEFPSSPADNSITTSKLIDGAVTEAKIAAAAVTESKIADGSISDDKIKSGNTYVAKQIDTITDLQAGTAATVKSLVCYVKGYYASGDGGEGNFWYDSSDTTSADNGGTIIVDAAGRRWKRNLGGVQLTVKMFGARGVTSEDSTSAFNNAISWLSTSPAIGGGSLYVPNGDYKVTDTVTLMPGVIIIGESRRSTRIYSYITDGSPTFERPLPDPDSFGSSYFSLGMMNLGIIGYGSDGNGTDTGIGIYIADSNKVNIAHVDINNFIDAQGLVVRSGAFQSAYRYIDIVNCNVGLEVTGGSGSPNHITTIFFTGIQCSGCALYGGAVFEAYDTGFYNCTFQDTGDSGGTPAADEEIGCIVQNSDHITFNHCHFERNRAEGLLVKNSRSVQDHYSSFASSGYQAGAVGTEDVTKPHIRFATGSVHCSLNNSFLYTKNGNMIFVDSGAHYTNIMFPVATDAASSPASVDVTVTDNGTSTNFTRFRQSDSKTLFGTSIVQIAEIHTTSQNGVRFPGGDGSEYQMRVDANKKAFVRRASDGVSKATGDMHFGGTTANRPANPYLYETYFDASLGIPIWHNGTNWVDSDGVTV